MLQKKKNIYIYIYIYTYIYIYIKIWDINVDNIVISNLVKTKTNYKYLICYLDNA